MAQAIIDLNKLKRNLGRLQQHLQPSVQFMAVVKANAYGHGLVKISQALEAEGVQWFAVATPEEALTLRANGISGNILVLTPSPPEKLEDLLLQNISLSVTDEMNVQQVNKVAKSLGQKAKLHLKVDTGMGRLGQPSGDCLHTAKLLDTSQHCDFEGFYTHFACADEADRSYTNMQLASFSEAVNLLQKHDIQAQLTHAANSAALVTLPESHFDMVRAGIALYGYHGDSYCETFEAKLEPILELRARVTFVKRISAGQSISYGATWTADKETTIASVRFGYGDGYPRVLSNQGQVWAVGKLRPIRGRVCMDQFMIDLGDDSITVGDDVTLLGSHGPNADDLAQLSNTISYEILTQLTDRVERVYL